MPHYRELALASLPPSAVGELLGELLGLDPGLASITGTLLARTSGNPFFAEELVRSLAEDGTLKGSPGAYALAGAAEDLRVPATVQAVLASRIDRLQPRDKSLLQAASVIGRTFTEPVLRAVSGLGTEDLADALQALCAAELLHEAGRPEEFRFWHPLTQEVASGSLMATIRRRHHRAAAQALLDCAPDRHDELAASWRVTSRRPGTSWSPRAGNCGPGCGPCAATTPRARGAAGGGRPHGGAGGGT